MKNVMLVGIAVFACAAVVSAAPSNLKGSRLLSHAKITLAQARAIALKREAGTIVDQELEREAGGSGLRFSFDVKTRAAVREVGVDAVTGKILEDTIDKGND